MGLQNDKKTRITFGSRLEAKRSIDEMDTILSAKRNVFIICCLKFTDRVKTEKETKNNFILVFSGKESQRIDSAEL